MAEPWALPKTGIFVKVFIAMPLYTDAAANARAVQNAIAYNGLQVPFAFEPFGSSLLPKGFNHLWAQALAGKFDLFAMVHGDIVPQPGWAQTLLGLLEEHQADVIAAVAPIKNGKGYTSGGIGDPENTWTPLLRFTMRELQSMPETFSAADIGWNGYPLLVNTGCWMADLRKPWCRETHEDGSLKASFQINSRVMYDREAGKYSVETESEDWYFSRRLHELGCKVMATQAVKLEHYGMVTWPNHGTWGRDHDELVDRKHIMPHVQSTTNGNGRARPKEVANGNERSKSCRPKAI